VRLDGVGLLTVEQLHLAGLRVVVVDDGADPAMLAVVQAWKIPVISGPAGRRDTLAAAGLAGCAAVVCVLKDDLRSLQAALLVRDARHDVRVVVQMRNPAVG
jgi:voltage-gated potassium channel Kch